MTGIDEGERSWPVRSFHDCDDGVRIAATGFVRTMTTQFGKPFANGHMIRPGAALCRRANGRRMQSGTPSLIVIFR
jgi:hypothetical protein